MTSLVSSLSPETIRTLRAEESRAAFARRIGVTPHTVYRWELPADAKDARRPRGAELSRLREHGAGITPAATPTPSSAPSVAANESYPAVALATRAPSDDVTRILPAIERAFEPDWQRAHAELLKVLGQAKDVSEDAIALAQAGTAFVLGLHRCDARGAFATIAPALAAAEAERLSPLVAIKVFAAAAFVHGMSDGALFDIGRVHAYLARVEALSRIEDDRDALFVGWVGALHAAMIIGDQELVMRAARRLDEQKGALLRPFFSLVLDEVRCFCAYVDGVSHGARRSLAEIAEEALVLGFHGVFARALGTWCVKQLDELADPEHIVAVTRRIRDVTARARLGPGIHTVFVIRAEADALLRMARIDEALVVLAELEAFLADTGMPPTSATSVLVRAYFLSGNDTALRELRKRYDACEVVSLRPFMQAYGAYVDAMAELVVARDPEGTVAAFAIAESEGKRWNFLLRDVLVFGAVAHAAFAESVPTVKAALRKAQRFLERCPSPWGSAHLRRVEGTVAAISGHHAEALRHLEAAAATFELAKDVPAALMTRHGAIAFAFALDSADAGLDAALDASAAELAKLGLVPPRSIRATIERSRTGRDDTPRARRDPSRLAVAVDRLAVRGVHPDLVLRVLHESVREIAGHPVALDDRADAGPPSDADHAVFELRDGRGGLLRVAIAGHLDEATRAEVGILLRCAELALDLAARSVPQPPEPNAAFYPPDGTTEDGPFVAASSDMRRLHGELGRLSGSKATVILTGESGTGKEIVARALVALSQRKDKPYVVMNCAAVPRDLFEGQLFGYRKGAFTGATFDHPGVIRAAEGGTLFLDEIGELPLDVQPKLLRFLENGEVLPLGSQKPIAVDVRVVVATHRDLASLVQKGAFREDLYYRLQVVPIHLAPLRERKDDVVPLALRFLRDLSKAAGKPPPILSSDARVRLLAHTWPGNVRELRNVLDRTLAFDPVPEVLLARDLRF